MCYLIQKRDFADGIRCPDYPGGMAPLQMPIRGRQGSDPEEEGHEVWPETGQCAEKADKTPSVKEHGRP